VVINLLRSHWHSHKNRFAQAMAGFQPGSRLAPALQHHALYRLGMYRSVAKCEPVLSDWRSLFAVIVSSAACGDSVRAELLLKDDKVRFVLRAQMMALADALLPFCPELADRIMPPQAAPALWTAALLRVGETDKARVCLESAMADTSHAPELHLYRNNALRPSAAAQMAGLNAFLQAHDVAPLALRCAQLPPGAMNLQPVEALPPVRGPLVSILMTAFRSVGHIASAIDSLLAQTYQDLEVIVVDDASDDETGRLVEAISARDARVRYVRLPVNVGTYVAKSLGLQLAKGEFVTCHDSDDWAHPQKIALQMAPLLADEAVVFTTSNWVRIQDDGVFYARPVHPLTRFNPASPLFRKHVVLERTGGWDWVRTGADSEFHARLKLVFGKKGMRRITKPLTFGAHRVDSLMTAAATGYNQHGISDTRLDYWEAWGWWHIESLRRGGLPKLPDGRMTSRPFHAPKAIQVPAEDIARCMSAFGLIKL
jgi:hypothetical protein